MKFIAIIPAFNPGEIVSKVIKETKPHVNFVILVDDGCSDDHKDIFSKYESDNFRLIRHENNCGKGFALITGFKEALKHDFDYIISLDSDGQHVPAEINQFKNLINNSEKQIDLIIGERAVGKDMPWKSNLGNSFTAKLFQYFWGNNIKDTQSGFRAFSRKFVKNIVDNVNPGRYETEMKILIKALRERHSVEKVKISTIYFDNNKLSKFRPLHDSWHVLKQFLIFSALGFSAWILDYFVFIGLSIGLSVFFLWSHIISKTLSVIYYYFVNKYLVFNSYKASWKEFFKYLIIVSLNIVITSSLLYVLVVWFELRGLVAKPMVDVLMFTANFFILKSFVYKS